MIYKKIDIRNCTCYGFDNIMSINDLSLDNALLDKKSYKSILIYHAAYKTPYGVKAVLIIFDKEDGHIRKYDRTKYLVVFPFQEEYERIFDRTRYLMVLDVYLICIWKSRLI